MEVGTRMIMSHAWAMTDGQRANARRTSKSAVMYAFECASITPGSAACLTSRLDDEPPNPATPPTP